METEKIHKSMREQSSGPILFCGSYEFKYDSGASEKHFIFLKNVTF